MSNPVHGPSITIGDIIILALGFGFAVSLAVTGTVDLMKAGSDVNGCKASSFMIDWKVERAEGALIKYGGNQSVYYIMDKAGVGHACTDQVVGNLTEKKPVVEQDGFLIMQKYVGGDR